MTMLKWVNSYIIGVCAIEICTGSSGLPVTSGIHEQKLDTQDQRAFAPDIVLKSSPLRVNRGSGEALRDQQSLGTRALLLQKKKPALTSSKVLSTTSFPPSEEVNQEVEVNSADEDEELSDDYEKEEEVLPISSSTEIVPKKKPVGTVRPFRSQQDLVESLKRRRLMVQQRGNTSLPITSSSTESEETQSKSTSSVRKYGNKKKSPNQFTTSDNGFEKKPKSYNRRYGTQSTPLVVEEVVTDESNIISQAVAKGGRTKAHAWRTRKE